MIGRLVFVLTFEGLVILRERLALRMTTRRFASPTESDSRSALMMLNGHRNSAGLPVLDRLPDETLADPLWMAALLRGTSRSEYLKVAS